MASADVGTQLPFMLTDVAEATMIAEKDAAETESNLASLDRIRGDVPTPLQPPLLERGTLSPSTPNPSTRAALHII
jgi:hypothetical protein